MEQLNLDNDFWQFSLRVYQDEEVQRLCLCLQDDCGLDVNLVLFCLWLHGRGLVLDEDLYRQLKVEVEQWRCEIIEPLRAIRRQLKVNTGAQNLREKVKSAELDAEQYQQAVLWRYAQPLTQFPRCSEQHGNTTSIWSILLAELEGAVCANAQQLLEQLQRQLPKEVAQKGPGHR